MRRIDAEERAQHIDTGARGMAPHAAKTGKTRSAPEAHHHRFGLIAGVMAKKKASALAAHAFQQQIIAHGTRPCLKPGARGAAAPTVRISAAIPRSRIRSRTRAASAALSGRMP